MCILAMYVLLSAGLQLLECAAGNMSPCSPRTGNQSNIRMNTSAPGGLATSAALGTDNLAPDTNAATAFPTTQQLLVSSGAGGEDPLTSDPGAWGFHGPGTCSLMCFGIFVRTMLPQQQMFYQSTYDKASNPLYATTRAH